MSQIEKFYFRCVTAKPNAPLFVTDNPTDAADMRKHPEYVEVKAEAVPVEQSAPQPQLVPVKPAEGKRTKFQTGFSKAVPPKAL